MTATHQTTECSIPDCYCHHASRQDAPLVQVPLEHAPLQSLKEALVGPFNDEWRRAPETLKDNYESASYWCLVGQRIARKEMLEIANNDLRTLLEMLREEPKS